MPTHQEVYFHVGLGKIASTYLQHRVFPKLEGITYIPTNKYKQSIKILTHKGPGKYLVSREFDRQFEQEVRWFTTTYPDARIIILFRRHDSWIASQYRRKVKNGWYLPFEQFFNLDSNDAFWKKEELLFFPKLEIIEECTGQKPLVLFHEELENDPWIFFDKISQYSGTRYTKSKISLGRVHTSYSEKQLKLLRNFCARYIKKIPDGKKNKLLHWLTFRPWWAFFHLVMYVGALFPDDWVSKEELVDPKYRKRIRDSYQEDWGRVKAYAAANNPDFV